jgi:hypothetical protein
MPCEDISRAWFIYDEKPIKQPILPSFLLKHGINLKEDFIVAGAATYYSEFTIQTFNKRRHYLLKPIKEPKIALETCKAARGLL